ncbi:hypothetical protein M2319_004042 [Rhodobium gokarnense]|uniref:Uncharacterized protein n=1 Tax=Rhodobium gokarnense TaxID=364296 RepID=A0ABT3HH14_9HYPH|nr:hypothetical protein [Rhodobium gokarnense]MCW2309683.1 hypothetical protein [Rhodobium gokarnense]
MTGKFGDIHAAHIRYGDPRFGKRATGMGEKADDKWTVPLCAEQHVFGDGAQHAANERRWWAAKGIDPVAVAVALWTASGDDETAEQILSEAREQARKLKQGERQ